MREFLKRAKADYLLSSVLCIVLGIIFVVWKGGVIDVIGTLLSVAMIIVGIIYLGSFILSLATFGASTIVGMLVLAVGIVPPAHVKNGLHHPAGEIFQGRGQRHTGQEGQNGVLQPAI